MSDCKSIGDRMNIDLLYFDGCPSWENGLSNLKAALNAENVGADIKLIKVENDNDAVKEKFLGSPSFHINGHDMWPEKRKSYNLSCRIYTTEDGMQGVPSIAMLREKIHGILNRK